MGFPLKPLNGFLALAAAVLVVTLRAGSAPAVEWMNDGGGHVKIQGIYVDDDETSPPSFFGDERRWDGNLDLRLTDRLDLGDRVECEAHYQVFYVAGDTYHSVRTLMDTLPAPLSTVVYGYGDDDRRRLFDLTRTLHQGDHDLAFHRLDRLSFSVKQDLYQFRLGRQALSWGNGLMFNPMDLVNPFSPTDTVRDYKTGDDLVFLSVEPGAFWSVQAAAVPGRDPVSGDVEKDSSTLAVKFHALSGSLEADVLGARHAGENLVGFGFSRNVGEALFRSDLLYSTLNQGWRDKRGYVTLVANLDRSWVFLDKNMYGLLEYHHNGLGRHDMVHALTDPDLAERISRGGMYVLGRNYLGSQIRIELHPLIQFTLSLIESLDAFTGIIQPRLLIDLTQNSRLQIGGNLFYGKKGAEFGGIPLPGTDFTLGQGNSVSVMAGYYF